MRLRTAAFLSGSVVVSAVLSSSAALAQNQVQNSGFDAGPMLTSWSAYASSAPDPVGTGTGVWDGTQDVSMNPASGSAHVTFANTPTGANAAYGVSQCVDLSAAMFQPVMTATFGTRYELRTGQTATGGVNVGIDVAFFDAVGCGGNFITGGSQGKNILMADLMDDVWDTAEILSPPFDLTGLPSPQSAEVRLVATRVGMNPDTLSVFFDSPYLAVNGALPVTLQTFEAE
jgi:hypothetical protein